MIKSDLSRRAVSEALGTGFLLAAVVGSGVMAFKLSDGNGALALLCNTLPTGAILTVLILTSRGRVGRPFQSGGQCRFRLAWRADLVGHRRLCPCADRRRHPRCMGGAWDVRTPDLAILRHSTYRAGAMVCGRRGHLWTSADNLRLPRAHARVHPICRWALHHLSLLVHLFYFFRQPGCDDCPFTVRYIHRHCAGRCPRVCRRSKCRDDCCGRGQRLVICASERVTLTGNAFRRRSEAKLSSTKIASSIMEAARNANNIRRTCGTRGCFRRSVPTVEGEHRMFPPSFRTQNI